MLAKLYIFYEYPNEKRDFYCMFCNIDFAKSTSFKFVTDYWDYFVTLLPNRIYIK